MKLIVAVLALAAAMPSLAQETRVYQTDSLGNIQYHKPSYVIQSDGRVFEANSVGNPQYHKPSYVIQNNGRIIETGSVGNPQYHKQQYTLERSPSQQMNARQGGEQGHAPLGTSYKK